MGHNLALGAHGEQLAADYLADAGMEIVERNWRSRHGEIDLIGAEGESLVFVEVKTRTSRAFGMPTEAVTPTKQRRIRLLGLEWLRTSGRHWGCVRFDVVSILLERGSAPRIDHIQGAF